MGVSEAFGEVKIMTEQDDPQGGTDDEQSDDGRLTVNRRSTLKGGAAGLAALGLGSLATSPAAAHLPADKVGAAGATEKFMEVAKNGANHSKIETLLGPIEAKFSQGEDVILQTSLETALKTKVKTSGNDKESTAKAGVLGWVEIDDQMVTIDGGRHPAPSSASELFDSNNDLKPEYADSVVTFNHRAFNLQTHFSELSDDEFISSFIKTRSTHGFNWVAVDAGGEHTSPGISVKGILTVFVDDDKAEASAAVRNRTLVSQPTKMPHGVDGHD